MSDQRARVAAFDVDGTLTRRDCVVPFLRYVAGARPLARKLLARPRTLIAGPLARDRDMLKAAVAAAAFAGLEASEVAAAGQRFAERVRGSWIRPDTLERLRTHQRAGHDVVLVSASFSAYLDHLAELLDVRHVLGTDLEVGDDGLLTGRLVGANCRGPEKVRRLHVWADERHGGRERIEVEAYGDSAGDRDLLADADIAHWVGRYRP